VLSALAGGRLIGARYGSPPARVVAFHGWRRTHADFDEVLVGLDAVAPDLPGFGAAAPPSTVWGAGEYADAVVPLCEEGPPVVVVGHSFGGRVAVLLAARHPSRVAALIVTGAPLLRPAGQPVPRAALRYRVARRLNRAGVLSDARMDARRRRSGSDDYRLAEGVMRDVLVRAVAETDDGTYRRALAAVRCPVEFVWGDRDGAAPPAIAFEAATLTAQSEVTVLQGVGHLTPCEAPAALRAAVERHL